ncbi:MAG: pyridoxamine 5'-phosphate oxidase family protein [Cyanobacteria bacterium]|nr:pyridoxamine 5'-phosphate oxidase family protein [Cyanobacteriota bacterium]
MGNLAPWRSPLARALHRNRSLIYARYLQLATVRSDGTPANRTVVFRGFGPDQGQDQDQGLGDRLRFVTDRRSEKIAQIAANPAAEACWYFPKTREQFRLTGHLRVWQGVDLDAVSGDGTGGAKLRSRLWQALSAAAQLQFAWPSPGGDRQDLDQNPDAFNPPPPDAIAPPDTFVVLELEPHRVDWLQLRGDPQDRICFWRDGDRWHQRNINP